MLEILRYGMCIADIIVKSKLEKPVDRSEVVPRFL